jgi:hypothetical protein
MKNIIPHFAIIMLVTLFISCSPKEKISSGDFYDQILDVVINTSNGKSIEVSPYEKATRYIPGDRETEVILADKLKTRGFKETNRQRQDFPLLEKLMLTVTMKKADCECEVSKIYYETAFVGEYSLTERIKCTNVP